MTLIRIIPLILLVAGSISFACMTSGGKLSSKEQIKKFLSAEKRKPSNDIPKFGSSGASQSLESKLGNWLLEMESKSLVISIPAILQKSSYHPFGDGQSNAKLSLGTSWTQSDFPVIGAQKTESGKSVRKYIFHPSLNITDYQEISVGNGWYKVQPKGWKDSFYFSFETSTLSLDDFLKGIPPKYRTFSKNRIAPNIAKVAKGAGVDGFKNLGEGYNSESWYADSVHGRFPDANGAQTALGGVLTWGIVDKQFGPFKNLYTCFEARNIAQEKVTGIPSGAGWHLIGDAAETVLNNLENSRIPVAVGRTHSFTQAAYGMTESITATWLQTDEVLVSESGTFHWYLNPYESPVCTEIWVHNCVPNISNNWGFNCQ